jgi:DNA-directed RNA polymerase specialized sigma24 family protein
MAADVLRMRVIDGLTDEEIAARLGVNARTIRRWRRGAYLQAKAIYFGENTPGSS